MSNYVNINLENGLGDQLLDVVGFFIICKYLNYKPNITFSDSGWGKYDMQLFNFSDVEFSNKNCKFYLTSPNPSASLSPYKVYIYLKDFVPELTFEQISNDFVLYSKNIIKPSGIITSNIPNGIEKAHGIHLRKSDKINNCGDIRHFSSTNEFEIMTAKLLEDVTNIISIENEPTFLIVSEDNNWKLEISNIINNIADTNNKKIKMLKIDYTNENNYSNYRSVLDMFCLSKCKEILQGVKYSTFSLLASLLGNLKLRNYSHYTESYDFCLIHVWSSLLEVNNKKTIFDIEKYTHLINSIDNLVTNIWFIYPKQI
jgi:hypothetical protein